MSPDAGDAPLGDHAAGDGAELRRLEGVAHLRRADAHFLERRIEQPGHRLLHLVGDVVDDRVEADVDLSRSATSAALRSGRTLKPMTIAFDAAPSSTSDSLIAPTPLWMMRILTLVVAQLGQRVGQHFGRALHVGLDDDRQLLHRRLRQSAPAAIRASAARRLAGVRLVLGLRLRGSARSAAPWPRRSSAWKASPGDGRPPRPSTSTGVDGPARLDRLAAVVDERAHLADDGAGDERVADAQRAVLHEDRRHRAAALVELRFEHGARARCASGWP